jgi:outer membrane protein OmpA-like peptidoglycan-associated protein
VQSPQGTAELLATLKNGGFDGMAGSLASLLRAGTSVSDVMKSGTPLVSTLFGSRQKALTDWISTSAGVRSQSTTSLLALATPMIFNLVGRQAASAGGFNASSLAKVLGDQWGFLRGAAPAGLAAVLGLKSLEEPAYAYTGREPSRAYDEPPRYEPARTDERSRGLGWLAWAIPLLLLPLLIWGIVALRNREPGDRVAGAVGTTGAPGLVKYRLSCGQEIDVASNGVESQLVGFIGDSARAVDKETWYTFDRLEFETGSATLKPGSQAQVRNIAAILKCYPGVHLKIGGYTDNVGDPAANQRLSLARAENTRQAVIGQGIDALRVEAEGYGEQHPVASNDTEQGRQRNRRIDVRVTRK